MLKSSNENIKKQLQELEWELNNINIILEDKEGKPKWGSKEDGQVLVKEAIGLMGGNNENSQGSQIWRKIWKSKLIPKVAFFIWLVVKNKVLTMNTLMRRGFVMANRCNLCFQKEEDINHILIHCDYTMQIWDRLWREGKILFQKPHTSTGFIQAMDSEKEKGQPWIILIAHIWWQIWKQRNARIFENKLTEAEEVY